MAEPTRLENLRTALAINRGIELLSQISREAENTVEHDEAKRVGYLADLFIRTHTEMFQDWKQQNTDRPGEIKHGEAREALRTTILESLCANGGHGQEAPKGLFDSNGFVIFHEKQHVAEVLAQFYEKMRDIKPFAYGNDLTLDFFMTALGKLPAFQEVYPSGIDLRRLDEADIKALHTPGNIKGVEQAMLHAMDAARTPVLKNQANGYGKWEKHVEYISGIPFLSHEKDKEKFIVTVNGGLVPVKDIRQKLEMFLKTDNLLSDFPAISEQPGALGIKVVGYLPGTESLREPGKTQIDGIGVTPEAAPLFSMDTNILTGVRPPSHKVLLGLIEQVRGKKTPLFDLANNPQMRDELMHAAPDTKTKRIVEVAYERLSKITSQLDAAQKEIFAGKTPVEKPKLYVSMGGAGSGKSGVEALAEAQCGTNFVVASLDEFRKKSDLYKLITAAGHHGDDYIVAEPFANTLRQWVADTAKEKKFNVLYDGTGVVYQPRYANVVDDFKKEGFHTNVVAVDTSLISLPGREKDFPEPAIGRVKSRFDTTNRALPWIVVTGKHTRTPRSFIQAVEHQGLDKVSLIAADADKNNRYLVAESFVMSDSEVREMQQAQKNGRLVEHFKGLAKRPDATLASQAKDDGHLDQLIAKNPKFTEDNVAFTVYQSGGKNRVLAVYNSERYIDLLEKGLMNPHASYEQGLLHTPATIPFNITQRINEILNPAKGDVMRQAI